MNIWGPLPMNSGSVEGAIVGFAWGGSSKNDNGESTGKLIPRCHELPGPDWKWQKVDRAMLNSGCGHMPSEDVAAFRIPSEWDHHL